MTCKRRFLNVLSFVLLSAALIALYTDTAQANPLKPEAGGGYFCNDMANEASYKGSSLNHFATLIPGQDGWIFRTNNDFRQNWDTTPHTLDYMKELKAALATRNAELVLVIPPIRGLTSAQKLTSAQRATYGLTDLDANWKAYQKMIDDFASTGVITVGIDRAKATENFFYKRNHHWSPEGAKIMAAAVAEKIKGLETYKALLKEKYQTAKVGEDDYDSSFERAFRTICKTKVPPERINLYETSPVTGADKEESLFGEQKSPSVILVGTSNSVNDASKANFEGFLKEYLSVDIDNRAVVGAGIDPSIISYLNSPGFKSPDKKIILWEIPGYYNLNVMDDKLFNQIIPAIYGACKKPVMQTKITPQTKKETPVFTFPAVKEAAPAQAAADNEPWPQRYVHVRFDEAVKTPFSMNFKFRNENKKQMISRDRESKADQDFYTLVPKGTSGAALSAVALYSKKPLPPATITLCDKQP
jgi:alginate biosynthesis protein AlgX